LTKFDEFLKAQAKTPTVGMQIDGSFQCQVCREETDIAEYFHRERLLRWKCPEGHLSYIEEMTL